MDFAFFLILYKLSFMSHLKKLLLTNKISRCHVFEDFLRYLEEDICKEVTFQIPER